MMPRLRRGESCNTRRHSRGIGPLFSDSALHCARRNHQIARHTRGEIRLRVRHSSDADPHPDYRREHRISTPLELNPQTPAKFPTRFCTARNLPPSTRGFAEVPFLRVPPLLFVGGKPTSWLVNASGTKRPFSTKHEKDLLLPRITAMTAPRGLWGSAAPCQCSPSRHSRRTIRRSQRNRVLVEAAKRSASSSLGVPRPDRVGPRWQPRKSRDFSAGADPWQGIFGQAGRDRLGLAMRCYQNEAV